jgi:SAM-dependent methyltransferase
MNFVNYPATYARFYDLIYHQLRDSVDKEFFLKELKQVKRKVLEIGTGTGRFFVEALNQGVDIYGLDISESMISVLLDKLAPEHYKRISLQNMVDFHYDHRFELIVAPFRVMMHLLDKKEQLAALNNAYRHLQPGGRFIFDTFIPDLRQLINGLDNHTDFEGEYEPGKRIKRIVSTKPDLLNQLIIVTFRLEWGETDGLKQEEWKFPMRFFFRYELEHLLERSDFKNYRILGDYHGNELNPDSKEFIVICQK